MLIYFWSDQGSSNTQIFGQSSDSVAPTPRKADPFPFAFSEWYPEVSCSSRGLRFISENLKTLIPVAAIQYLFNRTRCRIIHEK